MKIINKIITFMSNAAGSIHAPWINKEFNLKDYRKIEKKIETLSTPFFVGLVKTNGNFSNLLIYIAQLFSKKRTKRVTHAFAHIGDEFKIVESIGKGIQKISLLEAIGQRDSVVLRYPNPHFLNNTLCDHAIDYIKAVVKRDVEIGVEYDIKHSYAIIPIEDIRDYSIKNVKLDCSELIMQALEHGFRMTDQRSLIKKTNRAGKKSWSPGDIYFSELFITFYDSRKGFING